MLTAINRIIELRDRGCLLAEIKGNSDGKEMSRLAQLMSDYYGEQHPYTIACHLGVLPHYSNLPNGLRLAVEYAFRNKAVRLVVCTSTLAQGVNIPIKYLFMTSFMVARNSMQIRSLQNLMGRTARSGMYTEGSVIVTDPQLFDNKNNRRNGGNYKWKDCIKMFDSSAAEPCGSSILSLVQDIRIDYETRVIGAKVAQYIIDHYAETDCFGQCVSKLTAALHKAHPQKSANSIVESMMARKSIVEAIENHLCFVFSIGEDADKQAVAADICKGTLAYFMANDNEKALLERIFDVITSKISELEQSQIKNYARTMVGIKLSLQIEKWIAENHLTQQNYTDEQLVKMLISFFQETHTLKKEIDCFADICQMWLEGCSLVSSKTPQDILDEAFQQINTTLADDLLSEIMKQPPAFFEHLVVKLLTQMGYGGSVDDAGTVIGQTGDEGIDGIIREDKLGFSLIYIQAKRWDCDKTVGRPEIQKFVGALAGQGASKGLFITTAKFTKEARQYAEKQHTTKVVLVDDTTLAKLMIEYDLGVSTEATYEIKRIDSDFFAEDLD